MTTGEPLVSAHNVERAFTFGSELIRAVHNVSLEVFAGQLIVLTGRSGSGKTTLLNILAGLDRPTSGDIIIQGKNLAKLSERDLTRLRRRYIGFIFQSFGLLYLLSAYENVELPLRIAGWGWRDRSRRTHEVLELVGISERANHRPFELSGGEQQRVAIARALVHRPSLIFADEPTGELDTNTGAVIFDLLKGITQNEEVGIIVATHDVSSARMANAHLQISDGTLIN